MNQKPNIIPESLLSEISGGVSIQTFLWGLVTLGTLRTICEIPHIIMGVREFTNYMYERYDQGCATYDEKDHVTRILCSYGNNK